MSRLLTNAEIAAQQKSMLEAQLVSKCADAMQSLSFVPSNLEIADEHIEDAERAIEGMKAAWLLLHPLPETGEYENAHERAHEAEQREIRRGG